MPKLITKCHQSFVVNHSYQSVVDPVLSDRTRRDQAFVPQSKMLRGRLRVSDMEAKGPSVPGRLVTLKCLLHVWTCTDPALGLMMDNWSRGGCIDNILRFMDVTVTTNSGSNSAYVCL